MLDELHTLNAFVVLFLVVGTAWWAYQRGRHDGEVRGRGLRTFFAVRVDRETGLVRIAPELPDLPEVSDRGSSREDGRGS